MFCDTAPTNAYSLLLPPIDLTVSCRILERTTQCLSRSGVHDYLDLLGFIHTFVLVMVETGTRVTVCVHVWKITTSPGVLCQESLAHVGNSTLFQYLRQDLTLRLEIEPSQVMQLWNVNDGQENWLCNISCVWVLVILHVDSKLSCSFDMI